MLSPSFQLIGAPWPRHPVILSVPHAGRCYPPEMRSISRLTEHDLLPLEDRHADALVATASAAGFPTIIAQTPRSWIDLNRGETEYDPLIVEGGRVGHPNVTAKVRGGLGIIPTRIAPARDIWNAKISADAFEVRLNQHHRPYHAALTRMITTAIKDFGVAILIDIHSMPPIKPKPNDPAAQIVIGDLFGASCDRGYVDIVAANCIDAGFAVANNAPYSGGHILARHGDKARNIHALQIEVDRSLYLDTARDQPSDGLAAIQRLISAIARDLSTSALGGAQAIAAE